MQWVEAPTSGVDSDQSEGGGSNANPMLGEHTTVEEVASDGQGDSGDEGAAGAKQVATQKGTGDGKLSCQKKVHFAQADGDEARADTEVMEIRHQLIEHWLNDR